MAVVAYKIIQELLFAVLVIFFFAVIIEGAIPGFLAAQLSPTRIIFLVLAGLLSLIFLGRKFSLSTFQIATESKKRKWFNPAKIMLAALLAFAFLMIGNSMLKLALWENLLITFATLLALFYLDKTIFEEDNFQNK